MFVHDNLTYYYRVRGMRTDAHLSGAPRWNDAYFNDPHDANKLFNDWGAREEFSVVTLHSHIESNRPTLWCSITRK